MCPERALLQPLGPPQPPTQGPEMALRQACFPEVAAGDGGAPWDKPQVWEGTEKAGWYWRR